MDLKRRRRLSRSPSSRQRSPSLRRRSGLPLSRSPSLQSVSSKRGESRSLSRESTSIHGRTSSRRIPSVRSVSVVHRAAVQSRSSRLPPLLSPDSLTSRAVSGTLNPRTRRPSPDRVRSLSRSPLHQRVDPHGHPKAREEENRRMSDRPYGEGAPRWRQQSGAKGGMRYRPFSGSTKDFSSRISGRPYGQQQFNHPNYNPNRRPLYNRTGGSFGLGGSSPHYHQSFAPGGPAPFNSPRFQQNGAGPPYHPHPGGRSYVQPGNQMHKMGRQSRIDRSITCPFMLRIYVNMHEHYSAEDFQQLFKKDSHNFEPISEFASEILGSELQVYTWRDATLRELVDLVKDVYEEARRSRSSQLSLKLLHFSDRAVIGVHDLGVLHASRPGAEDRKTLLASQFTIGDAVSLAIIPNGRGSSGHARRSQQGPSVHGLKKEEGREENDVRLPLEEEAVSNTAYDDPAPLKTEIGEQGLGTSSSSSVEEEGRVQASPHEEDDDEERQRTDRKRRSAEMVEEDDGMSRVEKEEGETNSRREKRQSGK